MQTTDELHSWNIYCFEPNAQLIEIDVCLPWDRQLWLTYPMILWDNRVDNWHFSQLTNHQNHPHPPTVIILIVMCLNDFPLAFILLGQPIIQPVSTNQPIILQPPRQQQQQIVNTIQVVHTGNHCACRHNFQSEFTCCGICCAIFLFPVGLICCFCMRKQRCRHCNLYA